ncbi:MAG: M48 family metalloprotease [Bacteroidetes bacterium]|nr:M48 family metalloprotease [Bacteroidota bacterium]
MKKLFIWLFLLPLTSFTQNTFDYGRSYSDTIPEKYILNVAKLREHIYVGVPSSLKRDWHEVMTYRFADENAYQISNLLASGQVYSDWLPLENYLNEIFNKVIPKELKNDSMIHAYIIQDGDCNAFMTPSGYTFINIGLLAEVPNEAAIAGVLAHELGHYYLKHSLYTFIQEETGEFDQGLLSYSNKPFYRYSQKQELQADSLAIRWLQNSNYNLNGFNSFFETMRRLERNRIKRSENTWELKATTHPLTDETHMVE